MNSDPLVTRWYMYQIKHPYARNTVDFLIAIVFIGSLLSSNQPLRITLTTFATFRISYMVVIEEGPFSVFLKLRDIIYRKYHSTWIERGFNCPLCVSFWLSWFMALLIPFALWQDYVLQCLAVAGGCLLLNRIMTR